MGKFEIKEEFYLNGEKFKIISGGIHYFRVVPEYWRDRLEKIKVLGCNTVETYVAWNVHEPKKGEFCFEGIADIKSCLGFWHRCRLQRVDGALMTANFGSKGKEQFAVLKSMSGTNR